MTQAIALLMIAPRMSWEKKLRIALLTLMTFAALC
jgi:hypothetical protein